MSDKYTWENDDVQIDFNTDARLRGVEKEGGKSMPEPKEGEAEADFVKRCVPMVMGEGTDQEAALGKCYGIYRNANKAMGMVDMMAEGGEVRRDYPGEGELQVPEVLNPAGKKKIIPGDGGIP